MFVLGDRVKFKIKYSYTKTLGSPIYHISKDSTGTIVEKRSCGMYYDCGVKLDANGEIVYVYSDEILEKIEPSYLVTQLLNETDIATRFVEHANKIWNVAFPDDPYGWEYGDQYERCVINEIIRLQEEVKGLQEECNNWRNTYCQRI